MSWRDLGKCTGKIIKFFFASLSFLQLVPRSTLLLQWKKKVPLSIRHKKGGAGAVHGALCLRVAAAVGTGFCRRPRWVRSREWVGLCVISGQPLTPPASVFLSVQWGWWVSHHRALGKMAAGPHLLIGDHWLWDFDVSEAEKWKKHFCLPRLGENTWLYRVKDWVAVCSLFYPCSS